MPTVADLARRIEEKLAADDERKSQIEDELRRRNEEREQRLGRFRKVVDRIAELVLRPRIEQLVSHFDNASVSSPGAGCSHCVCRFESTPRFPASTTLELSIAHDEAIEKVIVTYGLEILPVFLEFENRDSLTFAIDDEDDERLSRWIDDKILAFVDTYLKLEQIEQYQQRNMVTDPVCKQRIHKSNAAAEAGFMKRSYYFCSEDCHSKFVADPHHHLGIPKR